MASRVLTVMFTDIKGFTERTSKSSRDELGRMLTEHEDLLLPLVPEFDGRLVKTVGDALMIVFDSPTNAVLCGILMQERLRQRNENLPEEQRLEIRIAINSGEMLERDGDVFGEAVNIAARIEGITEASEIYFTESVYLAMNKAEVPSSEVGLKRLKGVPEPIKIYRVIRDRLADTHRQLLERLQADRFEDVPVPSAGTPPLRTPSPSNRALLLAVLASIAAVLALMALFLAGVLPPKASGNGPPAPAPAPAPPPAPEPPDPVALAAAAVDEALASGDLALALARAEKFLKEHADQKAAHNAFEKTVAAETRALAAKNLFDDALKLLEERRAAQTYLKFEALERELLLGQAAHFVAKGDLGRATEAYAALYRTRPDDLEAHQRMARDLGASGHGGVQGLAEAAARRVAALTEGPLEDAVGAALVGSLKRNDPRREPAAEIRQILADRYPPAAAALRPLLLDDQRYTRVNARLFLEETGALTPAEDLAFHFKNLVTLRSSGGSEKEELDRTLAALEKAAKEPDWEVRKGELPVGSVGKIEALRGRGETAERVQKILATAFYPEIVPALKRWLAGEDLVVRHAAFQIATASPFNERFDIWDYHANNLVLEDYKFQYVVFGEAAGYFASMAGTNRADEARERLEKARAHMLERLESDPAYQGKGWRENFDFNLALLEKALEAFE